MKRTTAKIRRIAHRGRFILVLAAAQLLAVAAMGALMSATEETERDLSSIRKAELNAAMRRAGYTGQTESR